MPVALFLVRSDEYALPVIDDVSCLTVYTRVVSFDYHSDSGLYIAELHRYMIRLAVHDHMACIDASTNDRFRAEVVRKEEKNFAETFLVFA
jgi:hypothetical protein